MSCKRCILSWSMRVDNRAREKPAKYIYTRERLSRQRWKTHKCAFFFFTFGATHMLILINTWCEILLICVIRKKSSLSLYIIYNLIRISNKWINDTAYRGHRGKSKRKLVVSAVLGGCVCIYAYKPKRVRTHTILLLPGKLNLMRSN